jgi:hypothetical protein
MFKKLAMSFLNFGRIMAIDFFNFRFLAIYIYIEPAEKKQQWSHRLIW